MTAEQERAEAQRILEFDALCALPEAVNEITRLEGRIAKLEGALRRAAYVANYLTQMISPEDWRATGGDDGQGHYEGDYRAARLAAELTSWVELASPSTEEAA